MEKLESTARIELQTWLSEIREGRATSFDGDGFAQFLYDDLAADFDRTLPVGWLVYADEAVAFFAFESTTRFMIGEGKWADVTPDRWQLIQRTAIRLLEQMEQRA